MINMLEGKNSIEKVCDAQKRSNFFLCQLKL